MAAGMDMLGNQAFTLRLLDSPFEWRTRCVEEFVFSLANHVRAITRYECRLPDDLRAEFKIQKDTAIRAAVPLGARPKRELFRFALSSSQGCGVYLRERRLIASDEAADLRRLFDATPARGEFLRLPDDLLAAICVFTPGLYASLLPEELGRQQAVQRYLESGLGLRPITAVSATRWIARCDEAAETLVKHLREVRDPFSSSEMPLLALPLMANPPATERDIDRLLESYVTAITSADAHGDEASKIALIALCEWGRRWEVIVETEIPSDANFELSVSEDRPLGLRWRGWAEQPVFLREARSTHVVVSVTDPTVAIASFDANNTDTANAGEVALGPLEDARLTPETLSLYSSDQDRPYLVTVRVRLCSAGYIKWTAYATAAVTISAIVGVLVVGASHDLVGKLTVLTLPTTVAATFILVREQTALAARLERASRTLLGAALAGLWIALLWRLLNDGHVRWVHGIWHGIRNVF